MIRALFAGTVYFLLVFTAGFVLGTVRTLIFVPRVGPLVATLIEAPMMLAIGYAACRFVLKRWPVPTGRWLILPVFLMLLVLFEWQLGLWLFGTTAAQQWAGLAAPAGLVGLTAQILVALFPLLVERSDASPLSNQARRSPARACHAPSRPPL